MWKKSSFEYGLLKILNPTILVQVNLIPQCFSYSKGLHTYPGFGLYQNICLFVFYLFRLSGSIESLKKNMNSLFRIQKGTCQNVTFSFNLLHFNITASSVIIYWKGKNIMLPCEIKLICNKYWSCDSMKIRLVSCPTNM